MIINPNNIEKWCFDYFEGNLTDHEKLAFEDFILEHPEFHPEFEAWKNASDSEDEKVPVYLGMDSLIVAAPFYATLAFRLSIGLILSLAFGSYLYLQIDQPVREYELHNRNLSLNWNPAEHKLAVVKFIDFAYGDYEVKSNTSTTYVTHYIYNNSSDESVENESFTHFTALGNDGMDNDLSLSNQLESKISSEDDCLAYLHNENLSDEFLMFNTSVTNENYHEDDKTLYEHLGINAGKYQFLNFNNGRVKGIGSNNSSVSKIKNTKSDNHATIAQNKMKSGKASSGHKKKKNFLEGLKYLELGLTNINDPIAIVPNSNTIGVNPALAGQLGVTRLKLNLRNQWWATDASLYRGVLNFDTYIEKIQAGVAYGTQYDLSVDGKQQVSKHSFTYAQKFSLSKNSNLSVGLTYEMSRGRNASNQIHMNEFYLNSPVSSLSFDNTWKSDLGISTWYSGKYIFGGFNVTNLLGNTFIASHEENTSYFNQLNYSVQIGTDYKRSIFSKTVLSPYIQYNKMGEYSDLWLGGVVRIKGIVMGASVATSKSAKVLLGLQGNKMRFTISSDYSKSMLIDQYAFSHELSLRILLGNKNNNWSRYDY